MGSFMGPWFPAASEEEINTNSQLGQEVGCCRGQGLWGTHSCSPLSGIGSHFHLIYSSYLNERLSLLPLQWGWQQGLGVG